MTDPYALAGLPAPARLSATFGDVAPDDPSHDHDHDGTLYVASCPACRELAGLDVELEYVAWCPACGDPIDYCQGHGELGDPAGRRVLELHDADDHSECHPLGCELAPGHDEAMEIERLTNPGDDDR